MPRNYGPIATAGQTRTRVWRTTGENQLGTVPSMVFHEETVVRLADGTEHSIGRDRDLSMPYNPAGVIAIRNPETDAPGPVGGLPAILTLAECLTVLYALARHAQTEQDAKEAQP